MPEDFDLSELIAGPIMALNEAEAGAAVRFVELLLDLSLESGREVESSAPMPSSGSPRLRELRFDVDRVTSSGEVVRRQVTMPLLQMLPLGGVSIAEATLNYGFVLRAERRPLPSTGRAAREFSGVPAASLRLVGGLARRTGGSDGEGGADSNFDLAVKLRQIDLPQGVLELLQHTHGGIETDPQRVRGGDDGEGASPSEGPELEASGALFRARIVELSGVRVQPGEMSLQVQIEPVEQVRGSIRLQLSCRPERALRIREPSSDLDLEGPTAVPIRISLRKGISLPQRTPLELVFHGSGQTQSGEHLESTIAIELPTSTGAGY